MMPTARLAALALVGFGLVLGRLDAQTPPTLSLALTGDSIITRPIAIYQEPPFTRLIGLLRGADAAFTNLEMLFHDYEPYAMNESGGTYMRAEPALLKDLLWAGFDMVSRANNHAGDYGALGMNLTTRHVAEAGLVQAGVGGSLAEAREAKFLDTPKGRIALISVASTFPDHSRAGRSRGDMPARPGLNPLRFTTTYVVTRDRFEQLRQAMGEINGRPPAAGEALNFFGRRFVVGDASGLRTEPLKADLDEIAAVVRNASRMADLTLVTIHAHEGHLDRLVPAQFLVTFARAMVDAGADVFAGHGPHVLRGVEIYKGKPILYSLGDFIFQNETLLRLPSENYEPYDLGADAHVADFNDRRYQNDTTGFPADRLIWEAVVAVPRFEGRTLRELAIHPITLGFGAGRTVRGRPMLAEGAVAEKILGDVERLSLPYGTRLTRRDGAAFVDLVSGRSASPP
jgi:poly-gamma-glutamate synthesis protein (capsule biosynthesis protein)